MALGFVTLGIMAWGIKSHWVLWQGFLRYWVLCHNGFYGIGYYATLAILSLVVPAWGIVVLGVMSHCVLWPRLLCRIGYYITLGVMAGLTWHWVLCHIV